MNHTSDLRYPLFVVLDEGSVFMAAGQDDLRHFEQIDIENEEFGPCWDQDGRPFKLAWHDEACAVSQSLPAEPRAVVDALRQWAHSAKVLPEASFEDPVALWRSIDSAIRERSLLGRLRRFFLRR